MSLCGFLFDIIVVRIDAPNYKVVDPKLLTVDVIFNNTPLRITDSRINVVEFKPDHALEFQSTHAELRNDLQMTPMRVSVKYAEELIATGELKWADCVYNRVNKNMTEITHINEIELINGDDKVDGHIEIMIRLRSLSKEDILPDDVLECMKPAGADSLRDNLHNVIDPHDVLFIVADPNKDDECTGVLPGKLTQCSPPVAGPPTALDLSPYRNLNGRLIQTTEVVNTCYNPDCRELKNISQQYQELIDTLSCNKKGNRSCRANRHVQKCPHSRKFSSAEDSSSEISSDNEADLGQYCYAAQHDDENMFAGERLIPVCPPPMDEPCLEQTVYKTPRKCPVCQNDISWLPKLANCPKCGYKPVPVAQEKTYNENLTAAEILKEYAEYPANTDTDNTVPEAKVECRCKCKLGRTCANCRVRKMCEGFMPQMSTAGSGKHRSEGAQRTAGFPGTATARSSTVPGLEGDVEAIVSGHGSSEEDTRPHLAKVFSEMKDLFEMPEPITNQFKENLKCETELAANKSKALADKGEAAALKVAKAKEQLKAEDYKKLREHGYFAKGSGAVSKNRRRKKKQCTNLHKKGKCCYLKPKISETDVALSRTAAKHRACLNVHKNVPSNMGWLWNAPGAQFGRGWRPGAIRKPIREIMRYFLRDFPADTVVLSKHGRARQAKNGDQEEKELVQKPTLHICKKGDEIWITLRPLKSPHALAQCADPYLKMKPIQFKITKDPIVVELSKIKQYLKDMGFKKCTCHQPISRCCCRPYIDKKRLEYRLCKECKIRGVHHNCADTLVLSDTTDSEVEYDFGVTPPAGVIKPGRGKKPDLVNQGTQYVEGDWNTPPIFPKPPSRFMKTINCATGLRYYGGEYGYGPGGMSGGGGYGGGGWGGGGWGGGPAGRGGFGPGGRGGWGPGPGGRGRGGWGPGPGGRGGWGPGGPGRGGFGPGGPGRGGWGPGGPGGGMMGGPPGAWGPGGGPPGAWGPGGFGPGAGPGGYYPDGTEIPAEGPFSYNNRDGKYGKETSVGEDLYRDKRWRSRPMAICNPCCDPCSCCPPC